MPHDLFISYAHQGDNTSAKEVTALVARLDALQLEDVLRYAILDKKFKGKL